MILDERSFPRLAEARAAAQAEADKSQRTWYILGTVPRLRISQDEPPDSCGFAYIVVEPVGLVRARAI